jgi:hypothetical protein
MRYTNYCLQAFHWFSNKQTMQELHRVMKKGAGLSLVWNMEDKNVKWIAGFRDIYEKYDDGVPQYRKGNWLEVFSDADVKRLFTPLVHSQTTFVKDLTMKAIIERVFTKSYISNLDDEAKATLRPILKEYLVRNTPEFIGREGDESVVAQYQHTTDFSNCRKI